MRAPVPFPERSPPRVVDPVPPMLTVRVEEEVKGEDPLPINGWPAVVLVAVRLPEIRVPEISPFP